MVFSGASGQATPRLRPIGLVDVASLGRSICKAFRSVPTAGRNPHPSCPWFESRPLVQARHHHGNKRLRAPVFVSCARAGRWSFGCRRQPAYGSPNGTAEPSIANNALLRTLPAACSSPFKETLPAVTSSCSAGSAVARGRGSNQNRRITATHLQEILEHT